jgi:hypothetical protein
VIGHGRHDAGVDESVLLPVAVFHGKFRLKCAGFDPNGEKPAVCNEAATEILCQKRGSFFADLFHPPLPILGTTYHDRQWGAIGRCLQAAEDLTQ